MDPTQIAMATGIALLIVEKGLSALKSRGIDLSRMARQTDDLHAWHKVTDPDGVKVWYIRRSLEESLTRVADNIDVETRLLEKVMARLERIEDDLRQRSKNDPN